MMKTFRFLAACALSLFVGLAHADFSGVVVNVLDGDTVDVLASDMKTIRVRLAGIDAPEKAQAFGQQAKYALAYYVLNQHVDVRTSGTDQYGRAVGTLLIQDFSINRLMVAKGMAWAYRQYLTDKSLIGVEASARAARYGLWVDPGATAPWVWRAENRHKSPVK